MTYLSEVILLSAIDDPTGRPAWLVEFDGVLVGRFDSEDGLIDYLRHLDLHGLFEGRALDGQVVHCAPPPNGG